MSWYSLGDIYRAAEDERQQLDEQPPTACPNDGQPLEEGPRGELHCRFDGWTWSG